VLQGGRFFGRASPKNKNTREKPSAFSNMALILSQKNYCRVLNIWKSISLNFCHVLKIIILRRFISSEYSLNRHNKEELGSKK